MTGGIYNILAEEGSTLTLNFEYQDETGTAVDITSSSYVIEFIVKRTSIKTDNFMFIMRSNGDDEEGTVAYPNTDNIFGYITKTGSPTGAFTLIINANTMENLYLGTYFYSLRLINGSTVTPLCKGKISVESKVV